MVIPLFVFICMINYTCINGHDLCNQMHPGPNCPYCEIDMRCSITKTKQCAGSQELWVQCNILHICQKSLSPQAKYQRQVRLDPLIRVKEAVAQAKR